MSKQGDKEAAKVLREVENRIVWLAAFLVLRATSSGLSSNVGKAADEALSEYQHRFDAIQPPD